MPEGRSIARSQPCNAQRSPARPSLSARPPAVPRGRVRSSHVRREKGAHAERHASMHRCGQGAAHKRDQRGSCSTACRQSASRLPNKLAKRILISPLRNPTLFLYLHIHIHTHCSHHGAPRHLTALSHTPSAASTSDTYSYISIPSLEERGDRDLRRCDSTSSDRASTDVR